MPGLARMLFPLKGIHERFVLCGGGVRQSPCCSDAAGRHLQLVLQYVCVKNSALSIDLVDFRSQDMKQWQTHHFAVHTVDAAVSAWGQRLVSAVQARTVISVLPSYGYYDSADFYLVVFDERRPQVCRTNVCEKEAKSRP